jgi:hypothetical protein
MVGDEELPLPEPEEFPPLDLYCHAMQVARRGEGDGLRSIASQRPVKHLGNLAIRTGLRAQRRRLTDDSLFNTSSHHIALMRPVELVVKYLRGSPFPDDRFEWAGVFLVDDDDEVERAFAEAEPPAHDDWAPAKMERGRGKTFVNVALERLQLAAVEMGSTGGGRASAGSEGPPLARVAGRLGSALAGVTGDGAGERRSGSRPGAPKVLRPTASRPVFVGLSYRDDQVIARFVTQVRQDPIGSGIRLKVVASVAVEGAASKVDDLVARPEVLSITAEATGSVTDGKSIALDGTEGRYEVEVTVPAECAVTLDAEILTAEAA